MSLDVSSSSIECVSVAAGDGPGIVYIAGDKISQSL